MNETRSGASPRESARKGGALAVLRALATLGLAVLLSVPPAPAGAAESVRPTTVIDRADIELSGHSSLSELLSSRLAFNSFGLHGARFGTGVTNHLVNGRDIVGVNFQTIPLASVERVEILDQGPVRNTAWGIGSTVNIVLRNDFEGAEVWAGAALPSLEGRDERNGSALWGGAMGRGHVTVGVAHIGREEVYDKDRSYLASNWTPGASFGDAVNVSLGGNTLVYSPAGTSDAVFASLGVCDPEVYTGVLVHPGGEVCGYPYAKVSWTDGFERFSRESLSVAADHPLGDDAEVYVEARAAQGDSLLQWAPAVGFFDFEAEGAVKQNLIDNVDGLDATNFPTDGEVTLGHRFVGHGNREWRGDVEEYELTVGLEGELGDELGYDLRAEYYRHGNVTTGINFVSISLARAAIESGAYDIASPLSPADPASHRQAIRDTAVVQVHEQADEFRKVDASLDGTAFALAGGAVRWVVGVEVEDRDHRSVYVHRDSRNRSYDISDVLGTAGASLVAGRRYVSAMAESTLPVRDGWDVILGARGDDYSDVGNAVSLHAASRYRLDDSLAFRASWGRAARPPGLADLHMPEARSFPRVCDPLNTDAEGRPVCAQYEEVNGGNPMLTPSTTERLSIGATSGYGAYTLAVDWFAAQSTDLPGSVAAQDVVDRAAAGNPLPGTRVERDGQRIARIVNLTVQERETETRGVAVHLGADWETDWADLMTFDIRAVRTTRDETHVLGVKREYDYPRDRAHAVLQATWGDVSASWNAHYLSGYANLSGEGRFEAWQGHDLTLHWRDAFGVGLDLAGGVLNVANRGPSIDSSGEQRPDLTVDGVRGRTVFANATMAW